MARKMMVVLEPGQGGMVVARFSGLLDFTSAAEARGQLAQTIGAGHRKLIIDLNKVEFVGRPGSVR